VTLLFTDLDGTLLDDKTYSWKAARPALELLAANDVPWIIVSSKTRAEIEPLRQEMGHCHPFVVENGGAAFIPRGYFGCPVPSSMPRDGYDVLEWGRPHADLVRALETAAADQQYRVNPFSRMSTDEVCRATGLSPAQAARAQSREYDEPFLAPEACGRPRLLGSIQRAGFRWTHGGRLYHICGNHDKGTSVRAMLELFARRDGTVRSIGLGDSLNDLPLLAAVDIPVVVRSGRSPVPFGLPGARRPRSAGPKGWNEAVAELLAGAEPAVIQR
jgi:mannosyl-3-phosphoglycerate phosphatase family protein